MAAFSPLDNRYDRFLYASVLERDGVPLSVLSALTRQNLDPWEEATRLARLPRDQAVDSLAATISRSVNGVSRIAANEMALRLVELLPAAASASSIAHVDDPISLWLVFGIIMFMMAISSSANREPKTDLTEQRRTVAVDQTAKPSERMVLMQTHK